MSDEKRLGEQALSQVFEAGLASQLNDVEHLEVDVDTNLLQFIQGKADAISVAGHGVVVQPGIRVQEIEVHTDEIDINPLQAILGQISLNHAVDTLIRVTLAELDINRALNSEFVRQRLVPVALEVDGQTTQITLHPPVHLGLPGQSRLTCQGQIWLQVGTTAPELLEFKTQLQWCQHQQPILIEQADFTPGPGLSLDVATVLLQKVHTFLQQRRLDLDGMIFYLQDVVIEEGQLTLQSQVRITQPSE